MSLRLLLVLLAAGAAPGSAAPGPTGEPRYFSARPGALTDARARLAGGDTALQPALQALRQAADRALEHRPGSVTQKTRLAPSGDRHDYASTAPYWWPDPSQPDGLPYVRRDGRVYPGSRSDESDYQRLEALGSTVGTLALAYWFTGGEAYAAHAARCLRVWFLDEATRMNPNLQYGQAVPGRNAGRPAGLIEGGNLVSAAENLAINSINPLANAVFNITLGVPLVLVGLALALPRLIDAVLDPLIGNWLCRDVGCL